MAVGFLSVVMVDERLEENNDMKSNLSWTMLSFLPERDSCGPPELWPPD